MLRGTIFVNDVDPGHPCTIRDLSATGARLQMSDASWLPQRFGLAIHGRGGLFAAEIAWRADTSVGVAFVEPAHANS